MSTPLREASEPFRRRDAVGPRVSDDMLQHGPFRRLFSGVYVPAATDITPAVRARAALLSVPFARFATHHSAAALMGAVVPPTSLVHVGTTAARATQRRGIRLHRYAVRPELARFQGVLCTSPVRTFLDLAEVLELVDLVVLGDQMVARGLTDPVSLSEAAAQTTRRGARLARRASALVRERTESSMETRARLLFVLAGVPEPKVNIEITVRNGRIRYRVDLAWPEFRVAVEYDGRHHIEREPQWQADLGRREDIEAEGWRVIVLTAPDIFRTPEATLERTVRALRSAGMDVRVRSEEWRAHFPRRP